MSTRPGRDADRGTSRLIAMGVVVSAMSLFSLLPFWAALVVMPIGTIVSVLGLTAVETAATRLQRWRDYRRRRARFGHALVAQLPPGDRRDPSP